MIMIKGDRRNLNVFRDSDGRRVIFVPTLGKRRLLRGSFRSDAGKRRLLWGLLLPYLEDHEHQDEDAEDGECCVGEALGGGYGLGEEAEHYLVLAWAEVQGTQHVVHASQLHRLAVDGGLPSRIEYL